MKRKLQNETDEKKKQEIFFEYTSQKEKEEQKFKYETAQSEKFVGLSMVALLNQ